LESLVRTDLLIIAAQHLSGVGAPSFCLTYRVAPIPCGFESLR